MLTKEQLKQLINQIIIIYCKLFLSCKVSYLFIYLFIVSASLENFENVRSEWANINGCAAADFQDTGVFDLGDSTQAQVACVYSLLLLFKNINGYS